jgi:hypothetical protein
VYCDARKSIKAYGNTVTPDPTASERAMMNLCGGRNGYISNKKKTCELDKKTDSTYLIRRLWRSRLEASAIPDARTFAKRKMVIPPITASGIDVIIPANFANTPRKTSHQPQA